MNSIFLKLSLTLVCISSTLSFGSGRGRVSMRNSPLKSSQLRSPSASSRSNQRLSFLQLFREHQASPAGQQQQKQAQPLLSATALNRENLKKLTDAIAPIKKKITEFKNGTTYTTANLNDLQTQLEAIDLGLLKVETSAEPEKQQWGEASLETTLCLADIKKLQQKLIPYFGQLPPLKRSKSQSHKQESAAVPAPTIIPAAPPVPEIPVISYARPIPDAPAAPVLTPAEEQSSVLEAARIGRAIDGIPDAPPVPELEHPRYQRQVQQVVPQVPAPPISDAFRGTSSNQIYVESQVTSVSPMPRDIHKPLAEIIPGTPVAKPTSAIASPVPSAQAPARFHPLPTYPKPTFLKRNWKLVTLCTLAIASGLVGGEMKYKLLTRLGTRLFHGATITGQAMKTAEPSWFTKSLNWVVTLLWRRS